MHSLTRDIEIEDVVLTHGIENQLPTRLIHDHNLPLQVVTLTQSADIDGKEGLSLARGPTSSPPV